MDINTVIHDLQEYYFNNESNNESEKEIFDNYQVEFLDGFIGCIINKYNESELYEVYLYINSKEEIACPLLYKTFDNVIESKQYYEEIKNLINNNDEKYIINRCKIGL